MKVAGVVLAAGPSTRFQGDKAKQLLEIEGEPMVRRIVVRSLSSRLSEIVVVVGHRALEVRAALAGLPARIVENHEFEEGQSGSVRKGLSAISSGMSAAMFIPADQPGLGVEILDVLIATYEQGKGRIVVPRFEGQRGAPVIFGREFFGRLRALQGDEGGRQLFPALQDEVIEIELEDPDALFDIDSESDWRQYRDRWGL